MIDSRKMSGCAVFKWGNTDDENAADSSVWLIAAGGIGDNGQVLDSVEGINWKISDDGNGTEWIKFGNLVTPRKAVWQICSWSNILNTHFCSPKHKI
jgi:hypothetical protein